MPKAKLLETRFTYELPNTAQGRVVVNIANGHGKERFNFKISFNKGSGQPIIGRTSGDPLRTVALKVIEKMPTLPHAIIWDLKTSITVNPIVKGSFKTCVPRHRVARQFVEQLERHFQEHNIKIA
ncbi:hypothetical protein A2V71_00865 [Candidatus Berkelbacteria bacterium RBG_13_40_8]|uniref:Uncharacterized protein n=1 Tax=Candidatus Berkelbacteria bacterium RBG_13_40_8 TaxID=1797467 RepID=A0A1F5DQM4_9BACT|nr:MAG: hypothetical protein A2V71_00865 [Candidatus Berkelbacteria bacterium RBG_13_40_8]